MANTEVIGIIACGECGEDAEVKQSKKNRPYYTCDNCGSQHFSRGPASEERMLKRMRAIGEQKPQPAKTTSKSTEEKKTNGREEDCNPFDLY